MLTVLLVAAAVVAIYATTASGQRLIAGLGLRKFQQGAAPDDDRAFLLGACDGDAAAVAARLETERERYPEWSEAQLYRRAIRTYMNSRDQDRDALLSAAQEVTRR